MRRGRSSFRDKLARNSTTQPTPQLTESFSERTVTEHSGIGLPNEPDRNVDESANLPNIPTTELDDFANSFDDSALGPNSRTWSKLPELIDLSTLQVDRIPEALFAPETMRQPQYVEGMADAGPRDCQVVLAVYECGNYAFFTAQCYNHFISTEELNAKPVGLLCNPQVVPERYSVPYVCSQDTCPVCWELQNSPSVVGVSALAPQQDRQLPN